MDKKLKVKIIHLLSIVSNFVRITFDLDLRNNRIYGTLPQGLATLKFLHHLNVSFNNLCGEILQGGNLQRFDVSSYVNNMCLCGSPLPACT